MQPALRLGLRLVNGLGEEPARRIVAARGQRPFASVDDLVHRAALDARTRRALADAGALETLAGHRHAARWAALGAEDLPGFLAGRSAREPDVTLRAPREGEEIAYDYRSLGLTLRRHPLALLRERLARLRVVRSGDLPGVANHTRVKVAGITMFRQRPETASGVIFVSLEDETGIVNLVVWPKIVERQRGALLGATLMVVTGKLQREQNVTHVIAEKIEDYSRWLGDIPSLSRDFH